MQVVKNNRIAKRILKGIDRNVFNLLSSMEGFIAGGAVLSAFTNNRINDYDIYFSSKENANAFKLALKMKDGINEYQIPEKRKKLMVKSKKEVIEVFRTDNAITFLCDGQKYQLITAFYLPPEELFKKYDFTICMGAYSPKANEFYLYDSFLEDVSEKRLKFNIGTEYPICSLLRVLKYQKKGYIISGLEMIKMALTIHKLNLKSYADLKKQLQGIDTLFLKELTDTLSSKEYQEKNFEFESFLKMFDDFIEKSESQFFKDYDENPED